MKNNKSSKSPELKIVPSNPANDLVTAPEHYLKDRTIDPTRATLTTQYRKGVLKWLKSHLPQSRRQVQK